MRSPSTTVPSTAQNRSRATGCVGQRATEPRPSRAARMRAMRRRRSPSPAAFPKISRCLGRKICTPSVKACVPPPRAQGGSFRSRAVSQVGAASGSAGIRGHVRPRQALINKSRRRLTSIRGVPGRDSAGRWRRHNARAAVVTRSAACRMTSSASAMGNSPLGQGHCHQVHDGGVQLRIVRQRPRNCRFTGVARLHAGGDQAPGVDEQPGAGDFHQATVA